MFKYFFDDVSPSFCRIVTGNNVSSRGRDRFGV